jgi:type IV pilus assembly protein PilY1
MYDYYVDDTSVDKRYLLDGQPTVYVINDDGLPGFTGEGATSSPDDDERVIMVMGMRRGGSSYFALDVTDKNNPVRLWEINNDPSGQFPEMGQTWSIPQMGMVKIGTSGPPIPVAVFGGGYDASQDNNVYSTDSVGNAIYMVNLITGARVWSVGDNGINHDLVMNTSVAYRGMDHSIPAPPLVIDTNRDGLLDRLYVGDMGGRIWRMDFFNGSSRANFGEGGVIATLGAADLGSPQEADLRRFYNQVDLVEDVFGELRYFSINIGSGYRAHPLDTDIVEEFYAVRDFKPYARLNTTDVSYDDPITRSDLIDITNKATNTLNPGSAGGWRLDMTVAGEKVLGKSLTINGITYFTSFSPEGAATSCKPGEGNNFLYAVSLAWGRPVVNLDVIAEDDSYVTEDFRTDLAFGGIASETFLMADSSLITNADGSTKKETIFRVCASLVCGEDEISLPPTRTFWTEEGMQ